MDDRIYLQFSLNESQMMYLSVIETVFIGNKITLRLIPKRQCNQACLCATTLIKTDAKVEYLCRRISL